MARSQAPLSATTCRWALRIASAPPQVRSSASMIGLAAALRTCDSSSWSLARSAGRYQVERLDAIVAVVMIGLPPRSGADPALTRA
jgi:hypothetical protein